MSKKIAQYGMLTALAIIFSYVEHLFPLPVPLPGIKLGLANVVVIIALYALSDKMALGLSLLRIVVIGMLFGNVWGVLFSIAGGLCSFSVMAISKKSGVFSVIGVSVLGGVFHNLGQIAVAAFSVSSLKMLYYVPFLVISGEITGVLIGIVAAYTLKHLRHRSKQTTYR